MKYGMLWNAGGNVIYLACQWVITVLVTRITGFEDAGVLSLAMSLGTTLQTISMFGIRNFQVSDMDNEYRNSTYVAFRHITSFAALAVCIVFSIISDYTEKQFWAIAFYMLFRLAESYSDVLHGIAQKNDRLDIAGKALAIKAIFTTVAFFIGYIFKDCLNCVFVKLFNLCLC